MKRTTKTIDQGNHAIFPELATTLLFFIEKLYASLIDNRIEKVFFLSREGQPLMRMFETYQNKFGRRVKSHYLEVSRRSTLLPSLGPLPEESFENLFRQYRRISLMEFLSSLGLEAHTIRLARALKLPHGAETAREEDFSHCQIFSNLKALPEFQDLYESERISRRRAFNAYLSELSGGMLPDHLVIVDVGWKGTIQDNLFAILCQLNASAPKVTGYYVGLVAKGGARPNNDKHGLLFSNIDSASPKFRVFNENRALFEILLAADHGSIVTYETSSDGKSHAIRGEFEEGEMLAREVFPVQDHIFNSFEKLLKIAPHSGQRSILQLGAVANAHARMVYNPSAPEIEWFSLVFHVENYGVFERSRFTAPEVRDGFIKRMQFLTTLIQRRELGMLGFWPWLTLYQRVGPLSASIYAVIRRFQK